MTELDYGTLLCSATNKIGKQKHPCIFHIIAAGKDTTSAMAVKLNSHSQSHIQRRGGKKKFCERTHELARVILQRSANSLLLSHYFNVPKKLQHKKQWEHNKNNI